MGASSAEIERQITETRQHLDANLKVLERRAGSEARRAARTAAVVGVGLASAAAVGLAVYRLRRRRSPAAVVRGAVPESIRRLPRTIGRTLRRRPTVKVIVADTDDARASSAWLSIVQNVASTLAVSAAGALASRIFSPGGRPTRSQSE